MITLLGLYSPQLIRVLYHHTSLGRRVLQYNVLGVIVIVLVIVIVIVFVIVIVIVVVIVLMIRNSWGAHLQCSDSLRHVMKTYTSFCSTNRGTSRPTCLLFDYYTGFAFRGTESTRPKSRRKVYSVVLCKRSSTSPDMVSLSRVLLHSLYITSCLCAFCGKANSLV